MDVVDEESFTNIQKIRRRSSLSIPIIDRRLSSVSTDSHSSFISSDDDENPRDKNQVNSSNFRDFSIRNIDIWREGRKEINLVEKLEMQGLITLRNNAQIDKPLLGARIIICTNITPYNAVLVETLIKLGATVRWAACNIYSTQNHIAAAVAENNIPVFGWSNQSEDDFWWCIDQVIETENWHPNLIIDDGGDATNRMLTQYPTAFKMLKGIIEESLTGIHRLYQLCKSKQLLVPAMNVTDSLMYSKFSSFYFVRDSIITSLRSAGITPEGKTVLICGYGQVGKGICTGLKNICNLFVSEIDPICAIQASVNGLRVVKPADVIGIIDILITCTGNKSVVGRALMESMKNNAVLANMGHFNEIDLKSLKPDVTFHQIEYSNIHHLIFPDKRLILLADGHQINLSFSTIPALILSISCVCQALAAIELFSSTKYKNDVYLLPKRMDEYNAALHLPLFGARLTELNDQQTKYLGINKHGPFKPNSYSY